MGEPNSSYLCLSTAVGSRVKGRISCCCLKSGKIIKTLRIFTLGFSNRLKKYSFPEDLTV